MLKIIVIGKAVSGELSCTQTGLVVSQYGKIIIQSTLVISTSVISNNRLSRRENLIPVLT